MADAWDPTAEHLPRAGRTRRSVAGTIQVTARRLNDIFCQVDALDMRVRRRRRGPPSCRHRYRNRYRERSPAGPRRQPGERTRRRTEQRPGTPARCRPRTGTDPIALHRHRNAATGRATRRDRPGTRASNGSGQSGAVAIGRVPVTGVRAGRNISPRRESSPSSEPIQSQARSRSGRVHPVWSTISSNRRPPRRYASRSIWAAEARNMDRTRARLSAMARARAGTRPIRTVSTTPRNCNPMARITRLRQGP